MTTCDVPTNTEETVYTIVQPSGSEIQRDCTYRKGDRSNCILTTIDRYFAAQTGNVGGYNAIPKRILVKYTCSSRI